MNRIFSSMPLLCAVGMAACAANTGNQQAEGTGPAVPSVASNANNVPSGAAPGLTATLSNGKVSGKLDAQENSVEFVSAASAENVYEVTLKVHGMTLDATFSLADKSASFDGFTTATGADTQLLDEDRLALKNLYQSLETKTGKDAPKALDMLVRAAGIWSETGTSIPLNRRVMGEEGRGWTLLCDRLGSYVDGTHDDWSRDRWDATSSYHVFIGDYGPTTFYWRNGAWSSQAYDHANWPYEYGNCFGRCGSDCGSGHVYSQDCLDHDGCVRNGHDIGSFWCDDEFASTTDDFAFAPDCY